MATIDPGLRTIAELARTDETAFEAMEARTAGATTLPARRSVPVLIAWSGKTEALSEVGIQVRSARDGIVTADLPLHKVDNMAGLEGAHIELARPMQRELDISLAEIRGTAVHNGPPANRGAGVIIGIIDSGIDFQHGGFRNQGGQTRIRAIWDQHLTRKAGESPPSGFNYGVEYTMAKINQALSNAAPLSVVRHEDEKGAHGTHVAGIAAGDGSDAGGGKPAFSFVGVAPEAEIIMVANRVTTAALGDSATTLEAARYIFDTAASLSRPCVINMSQGDNIGPHDGTSLLERGLDALLTVPGRAFVKSAGNEGSSNRHASAAISQGDTERLMFNIDAVDPWPESVDIWYSAQDRITFQIQPPGGVRSTPITAGTAHPPIRLPNMNDVIVTSVIGDPLNGDNRIFFTLSRGGASTIQAGNWTILLTGASISADGVFHAWIERGHPDVTAEFVSSNRNNRSTISVPGTANRIITSGSYVTRGTAAGNLSAFSSRGPTRDARRAPSLCAPGQVITSARARNAEAGSGTYLNMSGTSMAAPHVAGVVALMLSVNPALSSDDIRDCLQEGARSDTFTGPAVDDDDWGRGKLDARAAVDCAAALIPPVA